MTIVLFSRLRMAAVLKISNEKMLLYMDFLGLFILVVSGYLANFPKKNSFLHFSNAPALLAVLITEVWYQ